MIFTSTYITGNSKLFLKAVDGKNITQKTFGRTTDITPDFSPDGSKIVFSSNRQGSWNLYLMPADGSGQLRQLTSSSGDETNPSFSPDGKKVVYEKHIRENQTYLAILNIQTNETTILGPGQSPVWSPANPDNEENATNPNVNKILFVQKRTNPNGTSQSSLWITTPNGQRVSEVYRSNRFLASQPDWSPNGRYIVFSSVDSKGLNGDQLAPEKSGDIWVINSDGSKLYQITDNPAPEWSPYWAKDGRIYFVMQRNGKQNVYSMKPLDSFRSDRPAPTLSEMTPSPKNTLSDHTEGNEKQNKEQNEQDNPQDNQDIDYLLKLWDWRKIENMENNNQNENRENNQQQDSNMGQE